MQRQETMVYKDPSFGGDDNTFHGQSIKIVLPPKPGCEDDYKKNMSSGNANDAELRMDVCTLTLSCLAQDPNLPSSKLPFAWKLYEMLETVHQNKVDTDIVSWVDDGSAFKVHDLKRFVDEIVPTYFKQSKYKSFQRQLYFYGFVREASSGEKGHTAGSYRHPMFVRGKKTLCLSMAPKKAKAKKRGGKSPVLGSPAAQQTQDPVMSTTEPEVTRRVSEELIPNDNSHSSTNDNLNYKTIKPLHRPSSITNTIQRGNDNGTQLQHGCPSTATIQTGNSAGRRPLNNTSFINPQGQFQQQQNQLLKLQMEGFLRSLNQDERQVLPAPFREPEAMSIPPQLHPSISDGRMCNIFGGSFHAVGNKKSR